MSFVFFESTFLLLFECVFSSQPSSQASFTLHIQSETSTVSSIAQEQVVVPPCCCSYPPPDVYNFTINGTGNVTAYGTMPVLGDPVTITFTGLFLDSPQAPMRCLKAPVKEEVGRGEATCPPTVTC